MASNNISRDEALSLFLENINGDITAEDMRLFVNGIFDDKEVIIRKYQEFDDLITDNADVYEGSLVAIYGDNCLSDLGIYMSLANQPTSSSQFKKLTNKLDVLVIDNLNSTDSNAALSANMGRELNEGVIRTDGSNQMITGYVPTLDGDVITKKFLDELDYGYWDSNPVNPCP